MSRSTRRKNTQASQLSLFEPAPSAADAPRDPPRPGEERLREVHEDAARLAARLPPGLHLGTSSWSFPGWQGLVYGERRTTEQLARDGLREYARHPLLTTVGIDRSFYAPVPPEDFARYARQLPPGFRCVSKALHAVVAQTIDDAQNPHFLSAALFEDRVAAPLLAAFQDHAGPVLLELPPVGVRRLPPPAFLDRLDRFFAALPRSLSYAVELRERAYFTKEYAEILRAHGVAHAYTYWRNMPSPGAQAAVVPVGSAPLVVVRLSLKPGRRYEDEKARFHPFDRIVEPDEGMRGEVARILYEAATLPRVSFVLINNKAEGCAPLTARAIAERVADLWQPEAAGVAAAPPP